MPSDTNHTDRLSVVLTRCKSNPCLLILWIAIICVAFIMYFGPGLKADYSASQRVLSVIVALVSVLIVHELIHALFVKLLSKAKVTIRFAKDPMGLTTLCTTWKGHIGKWQKVVVYLAPLVLLTLVPVLCLTILASHSILWVFIAMLNSIGAYYDLIDALNTICCT